MSLARRHASLLAASALLAVYLVSRILFIARFPYFFDEGTYASYIHAAADHTDRLFVSMTIGREPLQIWLGIPWLKLGFDPLVAGRLVAMTSGLLTVLVLGRLGWIFGGVLVGWVAAVLAVLLPFFVVHDGIGIYEPLVTLIVAAALLVQLELARRPRLRLGVALGVILAAGILTKRNTEPAFFLLPFSLLCLDWSSSGRSDRLKRWFGAAGLAVAGVLVASAILRSSHYWHAYETFNNTDARGVGFSGVRPLGDVLRDPFAFTGQAWSAFRPALLDYLTVPLIVAMLAGAGLALRARAAGPARARAAVLLAIWVVVPFVAALTFSTLSFPRHVMYLMPPVVVLAAFGLVELGASVRRRSTGRRTAAILAVGGLVFGGQALLLDAKVLAHPASTHYPGRDDVQYVTGTQAGSGWGPLADIIRSRATGKRVVVLTANSYPDVIEWLTTPYGRYRYTSLGTPLAAHAQFAIVDQLKFFQNAGAAARQTIRDGHFHLVARYPRPRGGAVLELYERAPR